MMDQERQDRYFMEETFPAALARLKATDVPAWGQMSPTQLVDHLRVSMVLSSRDEPRELIVPEEKLPALRHFLFSDKPMPRDAPKPRIFSAEENTDPSSLAEELARAEEARVALLALFDRKPHFSSIHPNFGRLDTKGWLRMHHKHFHHHLSQFGLLPAP
jgi:oxepin-CoA hydrolase/3-oxo-5,6-dehydrosuberyl-CoA semialdehyde dehydrogenase